MNKTVRFIFVALFGVSLCAAFAWIVWRTADQSDISHERDKAAILAALVPSPFAYTFNTDGTLEEAGDAYGSASPYWWLDSGAYMFIVSGIGRTVQGSLPADDHWRLLYAGTNPTDTDNGYHPQNIFRLVTRSTWHNFREEMYFRINRYNLSDSPNRSESNGILLFNRYKDGDDLYYAGLRVDGTAVIKKKIGGVYYTLDQRQVFSGGPYDRSSNPDLLPDDEWIGLRTEVVTEPDGSVSIRLFTDVGKTGTWKLSAHARDLGKAYGPVLDAKSSAGVRTDFMDVDFSDYRIEELD